MLSSKASLHYYCRFGVKINALTPRSYLAKFQRSGEQGFVIDPFLFNPKSGTCNTGTTQVSHFLTFSKEECFLFGHFKQTLIVTDSPLRALIVSCSPMRNYSRNVEEVYNRQNDRIVSSITSLIPKIHDLLQKSRNRPFDLISATA